VILEYSSILPLSYLGQNTVLDGQLIWPKHDIDPNHKDSNDPEHSASHFPFIALAFLPTIMEKYSQYPCFTDEDTEVQRS
jgi:hypothetical protein